MQPANMCRRVLLVITLCFLIHRPCVGNEIKKNSTESEVDDLEKEEKARRAISNTLNNILNNYDKTLRPGIGGPCTIVKADIYGLSIGPIIEVDMEFKIDVFFRQTWKDERLRFNGTKKLPLSTVMLNSIWYPDTYFLNGKSSKRHIVTTPNALFRISPDGTVLYTQRLTIVAECLMQLQKYPMDTQICPLEIGSNSYAVDDVLYEWKYSGVNASHSIEIDPLATMAQYTLSSKILAYNYTKENNRIGDRSVIGVKFTFVRHVGFFLIQTYIPCVLIVILSWVSFFLNREATPARVALGIMAILTITTMGWSSRSLLPKVSYPKAVDWFNVLCFAFVFGALVEFAAVNYFTKRRAGSLPGMEDNEDEDDMAQAESRSPCSHQRRAELQRTISRSPPESDHDSDEFVYQPVIRSEKVDAALRRKKRFTLLSSITRYNIKVKNPQHQRPSLCSDFLNCLSGNQEYREKRIRRSRNNEKSFNSSRSPCSHQRRAELQRTISRSPPESDHDSDEFVYQPVIRSEKVDAALRRKKRFTLLNSIKRYNIKVKNPQHQRPSLCSDFLNCLSGNQEYREKRIRRSRNNEKSFNSVSKIDEYSRVLFPLSFIVINAIFWVAYSF